MISDIIAGKLLESNDEESKFHMRIYNARRAQPREFQLLHYEEVEEMVSFVLPLTSIQWPRHAKQKR